MPETLYRHVLRICPFCMPYWYNEIYTECRDETATRRTVSAIVDTCHSYDSLPATEIKRIDVLVYYIPT